MTVYPARWSDFNQRWNHTNPTISIHLSSAQNKILRLSQNSSYSILPFMASFIQGIWGIRNEQTSESNVQKPSFANLEKLQRARLFKNSLPRWNAGVKIYIDNCHQDDIPWCIPMEDSNRCNECYVKDSKICHCIFARWQYVCHIVTRHQSAWKAFLPKMNTLH